MSDDNTWEPWLPKKAEPAEPPISCPEYPEPPHYQRVGRLFEAPVDEALAAGWTLDEIESHVVFCFQCATDPKLSRPPSKPRLVAIEGRDVPLENNDDR